MRVCRRLAGIALRFCVIYGLLIAPWPGFRQQYGAWMRTVGGWAFSREQGRWLVSFEPLTATAQRPLDTRILVADRTGRTPAGNLRAVALDLDMRGVGWVPTALLIALILVAPFAWPRRLLGLPLGLLGIHLYILFSIGIHIIDQCSGIPGLSPFGLSPFWKPVFDGLDETLITQLGASFVFPVILCIAVLVPPADISPFLPARPREGRKGSPCDGKVTAA
jgi:hypothetical protein